MFLTHSPDYTSKGLPPLKLEGKISSSSVTAGHLEVELVEFDFKVDDDISLGHINPLIWQRAGNVPLTPSNHSDLMTLIDLVVNDGICAGGLKNKLEFKSDYAIPSLRPDGVLTRDSIVDRRMITFGARKKIVTLSPQSVC